MPRRRRRFHLNWPFLSAVAIFVLAVGLYIGAGVGWAALAPKRSGLPHDLKLALIARSLDATIAVWFFAVGASIGSFLNVVAYRLPLGRTLGGHSACPYCMTTISASDNIPVFAWLRLRGRCRTCHLPISLQYPLVELAVGLVFLSVYFVEFSVGGSNLPGSPTAPGGIGLVWTSVTSTLALRVLLFAVVLSGLIAAALIIARGAKPPLGLFAWLALVIGLSEVLFPKTVVVPWWSPLPDWTRDFAILQSLFHLILGAAAGWLVAAATYPFLRRVAEGTAWFGAVVCLGMLLGWQAVAAASCCVLLITILCGAGMRIAWTGRERARDGSAQLPRCEWLSDPVVWCWLGLLLFRANWKSIDGLIRGSPPSPDWMVALLGALAAIPLAWLAGRSRQVTPSPEPADLTTNTSQF